MGFLRPTITILDDRRASVPLLRLNEFRHAAARLGPGALALSARLRSFMLARGRRLTFGGVANELLLGASVFMAVLMPILMFGIIGPIGFLGMLVGVPAAFSYFSRETGERKHRRELGASYVAEGICASCAYSLEGLVPEDDGCVVCPECGGAWRADRIVAPFWDRSRPELPHDMPAWKRFLQYVPRAAVRTTDDARGRLVPIVDPTLATWSGTLDRSTSRAIRRALNRVGLTWRVVVATLSLIPLSALIALLVFILRSDEQAGVFEILVGVFLLMSTCVVVLAVVFGTMFRPPHRVAETILRFARCPVCASDLTEGRAIGDRMTVCRGCGATWKPPR